MAIPLLEIANLHTVFDTPGGIVHAVNGISLSIHEGETLALVGESGCGKSVSMLSVMGLLSPSGRIAAGQVRFQGQDLRDIPSDQLRRIRGRQIAMVFQDPMTSLNPVLTVARQLTEGPELHLGLSPENARQRAIELLDMVGIPDASARVDDYPHQFSGGMRQRVMIAMALSCHPQLLIADEPTTALDVTIQAQILDLIKRLRHELGMAVIWITHDLGVVAGLADRVAVMYAGHIVEEARVDELYADPRHPYTLGLMDSLPRPQAVQRRRLVAIDGAPPDLIRLTEGCPFSPRCRYRIERCQAERPELDAVGAEHLCACWVDPRHGAVPA